MSYATTVSSEGAASYAVPVPVAPFIGVTFGATGGLPDLEAITQCVSLGVTHLRVTVTYAWLTAPNALTQLAALYTACADHHLNVILALELIDGPDGLKWDAAASNAPQVLFNCWAPVLRMLRTSPACAGFELASGPSQYVSAWPQVLSELIAKLREVDATSRFYVNGAGAAEALRTSFHVLDPASRVTYNATLVDGEEQLLEWLSSYQKSGAVSHFAPASSTSSSLEDAYQRLTRVLTYCPVLLPYALLRSDWVRSARLYAEPAYAALVRRLTGTTEHAVFHLHPDAYPSIASTDAPMRLVLRCYGYLPSAQSVTLSSTGGGTFSSTPLLLPPGFNPAVTVTYTPAVSEISTLHADISGKRSNDVHVTSMPTELDHADVLNAYSVNRLMNSYNGPALTVERVSDGSRRDVYFTPAGYLNLAGLSAFAEGAPLRVTCVYDQSPYGNDLTLPYGAGVDQAPELVFEAQPSLRFHGRQRLVATSSLRLRTTASLYVNARSSARGAAAVCVDNGTKFSLLDQGCAVASGTGTLVQPLVKEDSAFHAYALTLRSVNSAGRVLYVDGAVKGRAATAFSTLGEGGTESRDQLCVGWFPGWNGPYWEGNLRDLVVRGSFDAVADVARMGVAFTSHTNAPTYTPTYLPDTYEQAPPLSPAVVLPSWNGAHSYSATAHQYATRPTYLNTSYHYPDADDTAVLLQNHPDVQTLFIAVLPDRLQSTLGGPLVPAEVRALHTLIESCHSRGVRVVLHAATNGTYFGLPADLALQPGQYAEFFARLARAWRHWPNVALSLGNTPTYHSRDEWARVSQAVVNAVHAVNPKCSVVVPLHADDATPHDLWLTMREHRVLFSAPAYLDADHTGYSATCVPFNPAALQTLVPWCVNTGFRLVVHSGWVTSAACLAPSQALQQYVADNAHAIAGLQRGHAQNADLQIDPMF